MQFLLSLFCILTIFSAQLFGNEEKSIASACFRKPGQGPAPSPVLSPKKKVCKDKAPRPMRVSVRYTTPRGIGYRPGYTTLEGFFSQMYQECWVPFLDVRGHVFDDGRLAANAGLGCRYLADTRVWGFNAYYDYRKASRQHYNQIAAGLESLGRIWDVRLNGYLPVGKKRGPFRHARFKEFSGHTMYVRARRDSALAGANLEAGFHMDHFRSAPLYFNAGPYYLHGKGVSTWGGQLRAAVDLFDEYLRLEANVSYDHFFRWIGQGQVSVNVPFGGRPKMRNCGFPCGREAALYARTEQRVDRNEIIPVAEVHKTLAAIDPATGEPYFFVFVDNTSSSFGTFESPYSALVDAENNSSPGDIIYVFPGDGASTNMDMGIFLQDSQMLLGAATKHMFTTTLGKVTVPALAPIMPVITNMGDVITLANNNLVSGIYIQNNFDSNGIFGSDITNFTATNNNFIGGTNTIAVAGINLTNISGQLTVNDNLFSQNATDSVRLGVLVDQTDSVCNAVFINNTIITQGSNGVDGIKIDLHGTSLMETLYVANSRLENLGSGLDLGLFVGIFDTSILSNTFIKDVEMSAWTAGAVFESHDNGLVKNVTISNCNFNNNKAHSVHFDFFDTSSIQNIVVTQSAFLGSELGILVTGAGNIGSLDVNYCNFTAQTDRGVNSYVAVVDTFNLSNNTFIGSGGFALFSRTQQGTVANNQFSGSIREVPVFMTTPATSTAFWAILNNTFTGPSEVPTGPGYAAFIGNTAGSSMLCLDFFNNISTPTMDQTLSAYEFDNGAAGTFNITPRSTQANNIGKINTDGTIGSCSP